MKILVMGGTRFFGIPMVWELLRLGHEVTIATRQKNRDSFGEAVQRIQVERTDLSSMIDAFRGKSMMWCMTRLHIAQMTFNMPWML